MIIIEKHGAVSIWFGNVKDEYELDNYVDLTYDEDGDSIASAFYEDFHIDLVEIDEDFIEKAVLEELSDNPSVLLEGCSYEEVIIPKVKQHIKLHKSYNAVMLIYHFAYKGDVRASGAFDYIVSTSYE